MHQLINPNQQITFHDWVCARIYLIEGNSIQDIVSKLKIDVAIWKSNNTYWSSELSQIVKRSKESSAIYSKIIKNYRKNKLVRLKKETKLTLLESLDIVSDLETYKSIFWHLCVATEKGVPNSEVLNFYNLSLQNWGLIGQHYSQVQYQMLNECFTQEELYKNYETINTINKKYKDFWEEHYR